MILEYTFDNISGSTIIDTSGCSRDISAPTTLVGGLVGSAVNVISAQNSTMPNIASLTREINFWVKIPAAATGTATIGVGGNIGMSAGTGTLFSIYLDRIDISVQLQASKTVSCFNIPPGNFKTAEMNNLSLVKGDRTSISTHKLAINNQPVAVNQNYTFESGGTSDNANTLHIRSVAGQAIDQVRFYSRELEIFEKDSLYNGGAGC